jgi:hypothetical protein
MARARKSRQRVATGGTLARYFGTLGKESLPGKVRA